MSDNSDSQNRSEEHANLSEGTSPSNSSYDEDAEVTSKKKVIKKEQAAAAAIKPIMHKKAPTQRKPMSKSRASTLETLKSTKEEAIGGNKRKERVKKTMARVIGRSSMMKGSDEDEEEEEDAALAPKSQKLMGDAIKSGAAPSKPKTAPKSSAQAPKPPTPKRSTRNISAVEKNKAPVPEAQEDEEQQVLRKLKPKIPDHDDNDPIAENMKVRKDAGLRLWRQTIFCEKDCCGLRVSHQGAARFL
nr:nucleolar and coiled-body phosphoprotein 1-like [Aegilops tauschii subsp. strangulata]